MAFCTNCGNNMSEYATACPSCGHPNSGQPAAQLQLADFWSRVAAALLDGLILFIPNVIIGSILPFGGFAVFFIYNWLMIAMYDGRTLGKQALGIKIAHPDGRPVDMSAAAGRAGMSLVSSMILGIGYLWAAWDPEKRTLHDIVVDTRAFRVPR